MDGFSIETQVERVGRVIAWLLFALVTCTIAYFELVDHEAITDGDWGGLIAHAAFFASFSLCAMAVVSDRAPNVLVCLVAMIAAALLELVEIVPTSSGTLQHWLASCAGIWIAWYMVRRLGSGWTDFEMVIASVLWLVGIAAAQFF